jgi:tyrosinase
VRPSFGTLDPDGPQVEALRRGVAAMKARPASDPTSWLYQANLHGTYDTPALPAWNSCQHGSWFFLSWHRMYLHYFERILRYASGDPELALPFWDYTDPEQRAIPEPLRSPASPDNPLFVAERNPGINDGARLPESATTFDAALAFTNFTSPPGSGLSFGGQRTTGPVHFGGIFGQIESQPHNIVHVLVGGRSGWMSDPNLAARDFVFWIHHANIDRLWTVWMARGGERANPDDELWRTQVFTFFDEHGEAVEMTGEEVVESAAQLGYVYAEGSGDEPGLEGLGDALPSAPFTDGRREVVSDAVVNARLGSEGATVSLGIPVAEPESLDAQDRRLALVLEGIAFGRPGRYYEVYAGLPAGEEPDPTSPSYVGNVAIFGQLEDGGSAHGAHGEHGDHLSEGATLAYDVTERVERLRAREGFAGDLDLRFVPRGLLGVEEAPSLESLEAAPEVRIERVKLVRE